MKPHRSVQETDEDRVLVGDCAELTVKIHRDGPVKVYLPLGEVVQEIIDHFQRIEGGKKA